MRRLRHWGPGLLLLSPSLVLLAVFVYGLIAWTTKVSLSDEHNALGSKGFVGLENIYTVGSPVVKEIIADISNLIKGDFQTRAEIMQYGNLI